MSKDGDCDNNRCKYGYSRLRKASDLSIWLHVDVLILEAGTAISPFRCSQLRRFRPTKGISLSEYARGGRIQVARRFASRCVSPRGSGRITPTS